MMQVILYMSMATTWMPPEQMAALGAQAVERNRAIDVTGLLLFDGRRYMQMIEGPAAATQSLMKRIAADPRHTNIAYLIDEPTQRRQFAGWAMRQQRLDGANQPSLRDAAMAFIRRANDARIQAALMGFTTCRQ